MTAGTMIALAGGSLLGYAVGANQFVLAIPGICLIAAGFLMP